MDLEDNIVEIITSEWDLRKRIQERLKSPNLAVSIQRRFRDLYHAKTGERVRITGLLVRRDQKLFIEMPPRELLSFYPEIEQSLILPIKFISHPLPPVGIISSFKGSIKAELPYGKYIRKLDQIFGNKYLEVNDWDYDYRDVYSECPISIKEVRNILQEKIDPDPPLDYAILFSPFSAPPLYNSMGGISSLVSSPSMKTRQIEEIGLFLQGLVPSWHHHPTNGGFTIPLFKYLTPEVTKLLKTRSNFKLEFSPLIIRSGILDLDREPGFFDLDDPLVLERGNVSVNETSKEFKLYQPEIQWSIMWTHLQVQEVNISQIPSQFDSKFKEWVKWMRGESTLFNDLVIDSPESIYSNSGRRGSILRLMASMARLNQSSITEDTMNKTFDISSKLFFDFDIAYGHKYREYEKDRKSPYFGLSKNKKITDCHAAILDLFLSFDYVTENQMREEADKFNLTEKQWQNLFSSMIQKGEIYESEPSKYKSTFK